MTLLIVSIPLMVLGFAIAIVPLVVTMRRQERLENAYRTQEAQQRRVTDPYAHIASADGYVVEDERDIVNAA